MIAARVPKAERERRWKAYHVQRVEAARKKHEKRLRNLGLVLRLDDGRSLEFRGRQYGVPPVPWPLSMRVLAAHEELAQLQEDGERDPARWVAFHRTMAHLFRRAVRPKPWWRRILWPLTPSPLRRATPREVGQVLGFFLTCIGMDAGAFHPDPSPIPHGASPPTSHGSQPGSRRGATNGDAPAPGSTSRSESAPFSTKRAAR